MKKLLSILGACAVAVPTLASADTYPMVEGAIAFELQNDWTHHSDDPDNERNDLMPTIEPEATLHLSPSWSIFAHATIEGAQDPDPGENRAFEDIGGFVEDLYIRYAHGRWSLKAGKFTPSFGIAWDAAPGLYGSDFAEDGYELSERIGVAGDVQLDAGGAGRFVLSAAAFFLDTTVLAESWFTSRGDLKKSDGGLSNTQKPNSYTGALDIQDFADVEGLAFHFGFSRLAPGGPEATAQTGFAIGASKTFGFWYGLSFTPLVEAVKLSDADGVIGQSRDFVTLSGLFEWRGWNLAVSTTSRQTDDGAGTATNDRLMQISAGYAFDFGLTVDVGWKITNEEGIESQTLGALLAYTLEF